MNAEETRALWKLGRDAWNEWASQIAKSKSNFEEAGALALNWFGEAETDETRLWLKVASVDFAGMHFDDEADFTGFVFPGPADFTAAAFERHATFLDADFQLSARFSRSAFQQDVSFAGAKFRGQALFEETSFEAAADFERAEFLKERNGPLSASVKFQRTHFGGRADFRLATLTGRVDFSKAKFASSARFDEAEIKGDVTFEGAVFATTSSFHKGQFFGAATFNEAQFTGDARFSDALFKGPLTLERAQFWAAMSLRRTHCEQDVSFRDMRVEGETRMGAVKFGGKAVFADTRLKGETDLAEADFAGEADFRLAEFGDYVRAVSCRFGGETQIVGARFARGGDFQGSTFLKPATFRETRFDGPISFASTRFDEAADFSAIQSRVAFVLAGASFGTVPSFLEASFHEPPRVDHLNVTDPLRRWQRWKGTGSRDPRPLGFRLMKVCADPDASAKYRRLKKLAFEAQDQTREQEFFAQELRCRRFWHDHPFGRGVAKFWLGWFYGGVANFGRSMLRPFLLWAASIILFAFFYLSQRTVGSVWVASQESGDKLTLSASLDWLSHMLTRMSDAADGACVAAQSTPLGESLYLSLRNALLMIGWQDQDTARRVFGCLYGLDGPYPIVPLSVSVVSLFQVVVSAVLLFMFLLALRNLLKVR